MKNKLNPVAMTSLLVAAMRAAETNRSETEGRLFSDPYAELLAGSEGMELRLKAIEAVGDQPAIAIRTAFIDEKINKALNLNFRQIVILASGMDSRAYRRSNESYQSN
jgi:methyltransferase (TIGR00027 family)